MRAFRLLVLWSGLAFSIGAVSCKPASDAAGGDGSAETAREPLGLGHRFTINVGDLPVDMRLAIRQHEQQRGLMHVKSMPENEGMLFLYEHGRQVSFWMRNTLIPLDIGYFDSEGTLLEVHPMYPHVEDPVLSFSGDIRYALEMNQGWFGKNNVKAGAKLDMNALAEAVAQRGFPPETYVDLE